MAPAAYYTPAAVVGSTSHPTAWPRSSGSSNSENFKIKILRVNGGEDVLRKILDVTTTEPGVVFIITTAATLSRATISLPAQDGEPRVYEGLFQIYQWLVPLFHVEVDFKVAMMEG
ncbi:uncharacterized protein LOC127262380 isoform X2 [Andrographis paniculata]|nr:uncharacterized protein LOC127262380 isoform X2 [Andrographis paniculata]XP_051146991.1 uncharacterized protein LOC127262380 isoform X2 [Andrographis paniculata]XP_051146992.1 uncharacterized protein LOC127262380 isoform X2 [Andrographis paniculata]